MLPGPRGQFQLRELPAMNGMESAAGQQGDNPARLRTRIHEVPLRPGLYGGVQGSRTGGAGAEAGTVGDPAVVFVAEEILPSTVSPLRDVVRETRDDDTCQSGHHGRLSVAGTPVKNCRVEVWRGGLGRCS